ncbi:sensor histidine kinase [Qipengyuania sediminis]|uniref:sensor histidine kinase n=1 Tax=Qipengyuania sediminis TaxID=1532023 RepID=UPI0010592C2C|nr:ATP-binding protein [Qipengyuania sediminis]
MPEGARSAERRRRSVNRSVIGLLGAAALLLLAGLAAVAISAAQIDRDTEAVTQTLKVRTAIYAVGSYNERVETARRGFLISGDARFIEAVRLSDEQMVRALRDLTRMSKGNVPQAARAAQIARLREVRLPRIERLLRDRAGYLARFRPETLYEDEIVTAARQTRRVLEAMDAAEVRQLNAQSAARRDAVRQFALFALACALGLIALVAAAVLLVTRYNRELNTAQVQLRLANEGLEEAVSARTGELKRANAEIQRFAYIVSHDLRSPLVNVLGFTAELDRARDVLHGYLAKLFAERPELRDAAAWTAIDEDLPEALSFIRLSTEKMDRLITSILALSRQGRRTLTPEPIDLAALAREVAATLRQRAEDAGAKVSIGPLPTITSDRMAVEQILANLLENALKYLDPARAGEVHIDARSTDGWVEIAVRDNGRGIAPADHERIFDLFRRAGVQDQTGEGIGLANVRALAYRLGGRVAVQSQLGEGATFTVTLPDTLVASENSA